MGAEGPPGAPPGPKRSHWASRPGDSPLRAYALVVACGGWLAGMWLAQGPLVAVAVRAWLAASLLCAAVAASAWASGRRLGARPARWGPWISGGQVLIFVGMWVALGGLRGAWNNPAQAADAISRVPANVNVTVAGDVTQEPILEASGRLLVVDVHQVSVDGGTDWRPASGMLQVHANGPDDWFAPAYGDALQVTGKVVPVTGSAPADVLARMTASSVRIVARGGGSPLFARLFTLRVALAQAMQHALPEPEAALLIGILLGLKTPVLRARLALFTTTGTIHR